MTDITAHAPPQRRHIVGLSLGLGLLYALTAEWSVTANVDVVAAALPAWSLATDGTLFLGEFARANPWMIETADGWASNRPPGLVGIAVPAYFLTQLDSFSNVPATATAIVVTVAALVILYATLCSIISPRVAVAATLVMGIGTSTWQFSASALWPHGPGQLWGALGVLALSRAHYTRTGWALAGALVTRPITAVSTAVLGLAEAWRNRSIWPAVQVGIPAAAGVAAVLVYNRVLFGSASIEGGHSSTFADRLTTEPAASHLANVFGFFVSPDNGVFMWSPVVLVATVGIVGAYKSAPAWTKSAALAALAYIVIHARLNRVSGGVPLGYRYPLEPLMLAAPLLALGAMKVWRFGRGGRAALIVSIGVSILLQVALVLLLDCQDIGTEFATCGFTELS